LFSAIIITNSNGLAFNSLFQLQRVHLIFEHLLMTSGLSNNFSYLSSTAYGIENEHLTKSQEFICSFSLVIRVTRAQDNFMICTVSLGTNFFRYKMAVDLGAVRPSVRHKY
jgi:hypothetical protein